MRMRGTAPRQMSGPTKLAAAGLGLMVLSLVPGLALGDAPPTTAPKPPAVDPATRPAGARDGDAPKAAGPKDGDRPAVERAKPKARPITGRVAKVEGGALRILSGDAGKELIIPVQPETEVFVAGEKAALDELEADWIVSITQEKGLTRTIDARPPKDRAAAKAALRAAKERARGDGDRPDAPGKAADGRPDAK